MSYVIQTVMHEKTGGVMEMVCHSDSFGVILLLGKLETGKSMS